MGQVDTGLQQKQLAATRLSQECLECMELLQTIIFLSRCAIFSSGFVSLSEYTGRMTFDLFLFGE